MYWDPEFVSLADAVHEGLATTNGCKHPKWTPWQCRLVAKALWDKDVRFGSYGSDEPTPQALADADDAISESELRVLDGNR